MPSSGGSAHKHAEELVWGQDTAWPPLPQQRAFMQELEPFEVCFWIFEEQGAW